MLRLKIPYYPLETPKTASLWADQRPVKIGRGETQSCFSGWRKNVLCLKHVFVNAFCA